MLRPGYFTLLTVFLLGLCLTSCQVQPAPSAAQPWKYADVRILDGTDPALPPECDLIAAYLRSQSGDLQIRLDFLAAPVGTCNLYVALNGEAGGRTLLPEGTAAGMAWDALLSFTGSASPTAQQADSSPTPFQPRIVYDQETASAVISLNQSLLPYRLEQMQISAYSISPGRGVDTIGPLSLSTAPPPRAPLLLAYSSVLDPTTAVTARTSWDAAHAGPAGSRFGLRHLLTASRSAQVPVTLLDLRSPVVLSALDALGGTPLVADLHARGLLLAPDVASAAWDAPASRLLNRTVSRDLGVAASPLLYANLPLAQLRRGSTYFTVLPSTNHIAHLNGARLIPLPSAAAAWLDSAGITTTALTTILQTALSSDPTDLVVFHESLMSSFAGDARAVRRGMQYIAAHPWIHPLNANDLLAWPGRPLSSAPCETLLCTPPLRLEDALNTSVISLPSNRTARDARTIIEDILTRASPPAYSTPLLSSLALAASWQANPQPAAACNLDVGLDGREDCLLATETLFAVIRADDALPLVLAFRDSDGSVRTIPFAASTPLCEKCLPCMEPDRLTFFTAQGQAALIYSIDARDSSFVFSSLLTRASWLFSPSGNLRYRAGWADRFTPARLANAWRLGDILLEAGPTAGLTCGYTPLDILQQPQNPEIAEPPAFFLPLDHCQLELTFPGQVRMRIPH